MRTSTTVAAAAALALSLAGCGSSSSSASSDAAQGGSDTTTQQQASSSEQSRKEQWIAAVKDAGYEVKKGLTFENMYGRAKLFCDVESKAQLAQLARMALSSDEGASMTAPGKDTDVAAQRYADATWKYACQK